MTIATLGVEIIISIIKVKNIKTEWAHTDVKLSFDSRFSESKFTDIFTMLSHLLLFPKESINKIH